MQTSIPLPSFLTRFVRAGLLVASLAAGLHLHAQSLTVVSGSKHVGMEGINAMIRVKVRYNGPQFPTVVRAKINGSGADVVSPAGGNVVLVNGQTYVLKATRHISGNRPATNGEFNLRGLPVLKLP